MTPNSMTSYDISYFLGGCYNYALSLDGPQEENPRNKKGVDDRRADLCWGLGESL